MKITIPSRGRPREAQTLVELAGPENCLVYVKKEDYKSYAKRIDKKIIKIVPNEAYGMGAIRKYITKQHLNEDWILQLDDDVTGIEYKFSEKITKIVEKNHFLGVIDNIANLAMDTKTCLFGLHASPNPFNYNQLEHFIFSRLVACGIGLVPKNLGSVMFDERMIVNEDHDITLQAKYYKRFLIMDGRYCWIHGKTWTTDGGCSTIRNKKVIRTVWISWQKNGQVALSVIPKRNSKYTYDWHFEENLLTCMYSNTLRNMAEFDKKLFFESLSTFQKSIRRSLEKDAYYFGSILEDLNAKYLWSRIRIIVSEDIGPINPGLPVVIDTLEKWYWESLQKGKLDGRLHLMHAILLMSRSEKCRDCDNMLCWMDCRMKEGTLKIDVPDYALDKHTLEGKKMGRGFDHFFEVGSECYPDKSHIGYKALAKSALKEVGSTTDWKKDKILPQIKTKNGTSMEDFF